MHTIAQFHLYIIGLSILLILIMLPFAMNLIKPNRIGGVRTRRTLSDERVWYLANSYFAKRTIVIGVISIVLAVVLRMANVSPGMYTLLCTIALVGGLLLVSAATFIYISRI